MNLIASVKTVQLIQTVATVKVAVARNAILATAALGSLVPQTLIADPKAVAKENVSPTAKQAFMLR